MTEQERNEFIRRINKVSDKDKVNFFKTHFSDFETELEDEDFEIMIVQDETMTEKDNDVINYLEYHMISYDNSEILEMIRK